MTEIRGRTAVVTGGGAGIGMGLSRELARQGARVAVADIIPDNAEAVAAAIRADGGQAQAFACDVCDRDSLSALAAAATRTLGPVTLVFANAGATSFDPLVEMADNDVDWILEVNLHGVMNTLRAFLPGMIAAGGGHVCATSSVAGLMPGLIGSHAPYSAAKAGIIGLMMNLSHELARHGIAATTYCPGGVATAMADNNARYRPERFGGPGQGALEVGEGTTSATSMDFYTPEAIAPLVLDAVQAGRPFVFDHPEQRALFRQTYVDPIEACFDAAEDWYAAHGTPPANPAGPRLVR